MASDDYMKGWNACMLGDDKEPNNDEFMRGWEDAKASPEYILYRETRDCGGELWPC